MLISVFINVPGDGTGQAEAVLIDRESIYPVVLRKSNGFWQKCRGRAL